MRILLIVDELPWGREYGFRRRTTCTLEALLRLGRVDLFAVAADTAIDHDGNAPRRPGLERVEVVAVPPLRTRPARIYSWIRSPMPWRIAWRDWTVARRRLHEWMADDYDLVWFGHTDALAGLGETDVGAIVVDLVDLEHEKLRGARRFGATTHERPPQPRTIAGRIRRRIDNVIDRVDERRWLELESRVARDHRAVVCSDIDRDRLGVPGVSVVPNVYEELTVDSSASAPRIRRVVTMIGRMTYPPNADGACLLVDRVLPTLEELVPDVEVRLVGRADEVTKALCGPRVEITGEIDDVALELARADVIAVPIRFGSGTRIKILEAFAAGVPVVSTTLGCEGLGVESGVHLLVADDPHQFARACAQLLLDEQRREEIVRAARALHASAYRPEHAHHAIAAVVSEELARSGRDGG